jgi:DHA2 family multidrug resistance protein
MSIVVNGKETRAVAPPAAASGAGHPWLAGLAVMAGVFMVVLDSTVVNVSLPHIAGNLSATVEESTWALTSYLTATAVVLPITGWLASFLGRKRLLMLAISGFTLMSLACGMAPSLGFLIVCRILQGASGGVMQPLSQAVMLEAFPREERGKAMAFWGVGIVVAPILGPTLGGWLTDNYSWRWVFYINLPVGIAAFVLIRQFIFDPPYIRRESNAIDAYGLALLAIGIAALQIALDKGQEEDWFASHWIVALIVIAAIALPIFVWHEIKARHPVVDLRVFKEPTYATGVVLITLQGFVLYGSVVLLPIFLQTLMGYPPLQAGIALSPRGVGSLLIMPVVGVVMAKADPRKLLGLGFATVSFTLFWFARLNLNAGYWEIFWPQILQGVGMGMMFVPLTTITMDRIAKERMGNAASLFNVMRNIGSSVGIAVTQTLLMRHRQIYANVLGAHVTPYDVQTQMMLRSLRSAFIARGSDVVTATERSHAALFGMIQRQAAMLAFLDAFRLLAVLILIVTPLVFLMHRPATGAGDT